MLNKNTKYLYKEEEVLSMSREEIMSIISVQTSDNIIVYFDQIDHIDFDNVNLKNGEIIPITNDGKYEELSELFARYKLFCIMHDAKGNATSLQLAEDRFESLMLEKIEDFEKLTKSSTDRMVSTMESSIKDIERKIVHEISPSITLLNETSNLLNNTLKDTLSAVNRKIEKIDSDELDRITKKLSKISTLLAEVVD